MSFKMPSVVVTFKQLGITAIERSKHGIIAMVLPDDAAIDGKIIYTIDDIPEEAKEYSKEQLQLALKGYQTTPRHIICVNNVSTVNTTQVAELDEDGKEKKDENGETVYQTITTTSIDYTDTLKRLEAMKWDWLVIPGIAAEKTDAIATWIKGMRTNKDKLVKAVLPKCPADTEGVVNFVNETIRTAEKNYSTADYCSRVAGIICGTPNTISCTYAPAPELIEVDLHTQDEMNEMVSKGQFFFFNDGEKIKVARGVNSFITTIQDKGSDFQKIKLVDLLDMVHDDIVKTGHDSYIGKYANSADNRALLVTAIQGYLDTLESEGLLERHQNTVDIDVQAVKNWRESNGLNTKAELMSMKDSEIKELNIHDQVFLAAELSPLDAIEDIRIGCNVQ